ncbi:helix-turn-helix domain-containing protein [Metabacillus lacus]|uniref:helix-turn-helix domain-containing protein n=1 Tax=Metabacillus lacus TaxID=1983721 RepID=UPI003CCCA6EB
MDIQQQLMHNLKSLRKMRNYSYDQLSALTGVSKGMLSQIEKGEASPTISTLWKIANGLQVSFSSLIEESSAGPDIVKRAEKEPVTSSSEAFQLFSYFPFHHQRKFEIYYIELSPDSRHESEEHHGGVEEYILVTEGQVTVDIAQEHYRLGKGDALRFQANREHFYSNETRNPAGFYLLIYYPLSS